LKFFTLVLFLRQLTRVIRSENVLFYLVKSEWVLIDEYFAYMCRNMMECSGIGSGRALPSQVPLTDQSPPSWTVSVYRLICCGT
jgi:hypothetical protein